MASPLSYAGALRALRWAAQTPWTSPTLSAVEAHGLTLHSLKVTMLSAAAQLRLPRQARALQGHHTAGSTQLYSRDDTVDAVCLQQQISGEVRRGWRPTRPLQRGGQPAMPDPPFLLSGNELPDTLEPSLAYFQEEPNRAPHNEVISLTEVDSSESSSLSSSDSDTDDENQSTPVPLEFGEIQFVQNGPSGCCHVAMEAKIITPPAQTVTLDNRSWSTKCGASLRKTATPITLAQIKWPCQRKACRAVFDAMINVSTEMSKGVVPFFFNSVFLSTPFINPHQRRKSVLTNVESSLCVVQFFSGGSRLLHGPPKIFWNDGYNCPPLRVHLHAWR